MIKVSLGDTENPFQFKMEALDETKANLINVIFNVIFDPDFNFVFLNFFKMKRGAIEAVIYGCIRGLDGASLECMPSVSMAYNKV